MQILKFFLLLGLTASCAVWGGELDEAVQDHCTRALFILGSQHVTVHGRSITASPLERLDELQKALGQIAERHTVSSLRDLYLSKDGKSLKRMFRERGQKLFREIQVDEELFRWQGNISFNGELNFHVVTQFVLKNHVCPADEDGPLSLSVKLAEANRDHWSQSLRSLAKPDEEIWNEKTASGFSRTDQGRLILTGTVDDFGSTLLALMWMALNPDVLEIYLAEVSAQGESYSRLVDGVLDAARNAHRRRTEESDRDKLIRSNESLREAINRLNNRMDDFLKKN